MMKIKLSSRKNKAVQYVVGATVAVIILGIWVSLPLSNTSSMSSNAAAGNPFKSKVADISSLGSDISLEGGAPGSPLSGEMIDNPATSGNETASSLFQSGIPGEEAAAASVSADSGPAAPSAGGGGGGGYAGSSGGGAPAQARGGKLAAVASLSGSNSNSMTAGGGKHDKFFGGGGQKAQFAPSTGADLKKMAASPQEKKGGALTAMLNNVAEKGQLAAKTGNSDASRGGASEAFSGGGSKGTSKDLNGHKEEAAAVSGLSLGEAAADLKQSDPSISKSKITPPPASAAKEVVDPEEEAKQKLIEMLMKVVMGSVMGAL